MLKAEVEAQEATILDIAVVAALGVEVDLTTGVEALMVEVATPEHTDQQDTLTMLLLTAIVTAGEAEAPRL